MKDTLRVVEEVYERFAQADIEGFLNLCADDIEWIVNGPSTLEKCNAYFGRAGVQEFLNILNNSWEFSSFAAKQFIVKGNTALVLGDESGTDINTSKIFENRWAHVFDVKAEKIIRFREFLCHWTNGEKPPPMSWTVY